MKRMYWLVAGVFIVAMLGVRPSFAQPCAVQIQTYQLNLDNVDWPMTVGDGRSCTGGFRVRNVTLESVRLVLPPEHGQVRLQGPGFTYRAQPGFRGQDSFTVVVSGSLKKAAGTSTIRVLISVTEAGGAIPAPLQ